MDSFLEKLIENPIWQGIGIVAMLISFYWYTQRDDKKIIKIFIVSNVFWISHFYLIWVLSAAAVNLVWIFRLFLSLKYKKNIKMFFWIVIATIILWIVTYENELSILPIIWSCMSAYSYFFLEKLRLRMLIFLTSIVWFTFSYLSWSVWWAINEIIVQIILIFTMYKLVKYEWEKVYFVDKIFEIISRPKQRPDLWRLVFIYDYIKLRKWWFKNKLNNIWKKAKQYYKKVNSVKINIFKKGKKFIEIEKV